MLSGTEPSIPPVTVTADRAELVRVLETLTADFMCPQFLPSDDARRNEVERFALALAEIGLSYEDAVKVRRALLARHHCLRGAAST